MITVTIQCANIRELQSEVEKFLQNSTDENQTEFDLDVPVKEEKKPRKRRTKAELEVSNLSEGTVVKTHNIGTDEYPSYSLQMALKDIHDKAALNAHKAVSVPVRPTKEEVHAALQGVISALDIATARSILTAFSANKLPELKEENYQAFVKKCNEAIAAGV